MKSFYNYDLVISFASEDNSVAKDLTKLLRRKGLKVYYYKNAPNFGENLKTVTRNVFQEQANNALIILSKDYLYKSITISELKHLKTAKQNGSLSKIFILKVDENIELQGMQDIIYKVWDNNPRQAAKDIYKSIKGPIIICPFLRSSFYTTLIILLLIFLLYYLIQNPHFIVAQIIGY